MRYINVENGVVTEVRSVFRMRLSGWIAHDTAKVGDLYVDGVLTPVTPVPQSVTMRQARQALILAGKDEQVDAALAAISGQAGKLARAEWEKSQTVERNRPLVLQMGAALGMTAADLDALFILAGKL